MKPKKTFMAAALACAVTTVAYAADLDANAALGGTPADTVVVTGDATVNGTLTVQPAPGAGPIVSTNGNIGGAPSVIDNGNGTSTLVTLANTVSVDQTTTTDGGVTLTADGNGTFDAQVVVGEQAVYYVYNVETIDNNTLLPVAVPPASDGIWASDEANQANYVPATEANPANNPWADVPVLTPNPADVSTWVADATDADYAGAVTFNPTGPPVVSGGNVQIDGTANVDGVLSVADNGAGGVADVDAAINGNAADIVTEAGLRVAGDAATLASANSYTDGEVATERTARIAADNLLQLNINNNESDSDTADLALGGRIDEEIQDRADLIRRAAPGDPIHIGSNSFLLDDTVLNHVLTTDSGTEIILGGDIASTTLDDETRDIRVARDLTVGGGAEILGNLHVGEITNVEQAINANTADIAIIDGNDSTNGSFRKSIKDEATLRFDADAMLQDSIVGETNARQAADSRLQGGIDENTRGIAMVAAMTNTRVEAGKTHGVDFNMAQFQSETGFAFGYANRINDNLQVHGSLASTTDFDESVVRVGVAVQW